LVRRWVRLGGRWQESVISRERERERWSFLTLWRLEKQVERLTEEMWSVTRERSRETRL
jgi:hypothetical protein